MRRKATIVVLGILLGACGFSKEQFTADAALPPVEVGFVVDQQLQDEGSGLIQVVVRLSRPAPEPISVNYAFTGGDALMDVDYMGTGGTLSWSEQTTDQFIPIMITFDTMEENDETIELTLSSPSNAKLGDITHHTITISAKPLPRVNITAAVSDADEAGNITIDMTLDAAPQVVSSATIAFKMTSTAAVGFDFSMPVNATVTFPVNTMTGSITIPVMNDTTDEDDEVVELEILSTMNVVIGPSKTRSHTIHDNDAAPTVSIMTANAMTMEKNAGMSTTVMLTVQLSAGSGKTVTVPITYGGGTATEGTGADYTYVAKGDLVFTPNQDPSMSQVTKTISITINGDVVDEDEQTIITSLGAAPMNATLGATTSQTQTIMDDDAAPTVNFITANMTEFENDSGTVAYNYVLELTAASERSIAFDITLGGAATIPSDYTTTPTNSTTTVHFTIVPAVAGTLGGTQATLTLTVKGDTMNEGADETITMDISNSGLVNVSRGSERARVHTIADSDP